MADALERVTNLLALLLESRRPLSLAEIVGELSGQYPDTEQAARGAFERDKSMLRSVGVPLEQEVRGGAEAGQTAYWIDRKRYELEQLTLSDDERRALQMAVAAVHSDASWGRDGLWKIGSGPSTARTQAVSANMPVLDNLPELREATARRVAARLRYRGVTRMLDPYGLLLRGGWWYVVGFDHSHGEVRTFRVDRIEGDVELDPQASFQRPQDFDIRSVFPADPKLLGEPDSDEHVALVRVFAPMTELVIREIGDAAVRARFGDGSAEMEVPCVHRRAFRSWVLGLGEHAEVLEPADLRAEIVDWLDAVIAGAQA